MVADNEDVDTYKVERGELKSCGHYCYPSTLPKCCACEDVRPHSDEGYEIYVDGVGYTTTMERDKDYCCVCNTKNYDRWMEKVQAQTRKKQLEDEARARLEQERAELAEADRLRNSDKEEGRVEYSNGNIYQGQLKDGKPNGFGVMTYGLGNEDELVRYEGEWKEGLFHGKGHKVWFDDMFYKGEFENGMMHGQGICQMNDVDVMEGRFEEDVFQD